MNPFRPSALQGLVPAVVLAVSPAAPAQGPAMPTLVPATLDAALRSGKWLIVEFGGETCIPCVRMQPVLRQLQTRLGARVLVHNFWIQAHPDTARRFGIMVMPTQIVFDPKGQEVLRHQGYWDLESFQTALKAKGAL